MKNIISKISFLIAICTIGMFSSCGLGDDLDDVVKDENLTEFVDGPEGWRIEGDAIQSDPMFSDTSGVENSGYIFADDYTTGGVWYFVAPERYHSKVLNYNGYLHFYLIQKSAMSNQFNDRDIIIDGGEKGALTYYFDSFPGTTWTEYKVKINEEADWYDEDGFIADESKIRSVLLNIKKISIRGEFESGPDTGGLDKFTVL